MRGWYSSGRFGPFVLKSAWFYYYQSMIVSQKPTAFGNVINMKRIFTHSLPVPLTYHQGNRLHVFYSIKKWYLGVTMSEYYIIQIYKPLKLFFKHLFWQYFTGSNGRLLSLRTSPCSWMDGVLITKLMINPSEGKRRNILCNYLFLFSSVMSMNVVFNLLIVSLSVSLNFYYCSAVIGPSVMLYN